MYILKLILPLVGMVWQLVATVLGWKFPLTMQKLVAPQIILSLGLFLLFEIESYQETRAVNCLTLLLTLANVSSVLINVSWLLTIPSQLILFGGTMVFFHTGLNYDLKKILISFLI